MAGLWDALKQYIGDALPGGALNPETQPVATRANYLSGMLDPASQVSQDAQAWHKRTQNGLMDQLAGRDTPEAEQAYQTMMQAAGMAPVGMIAWHGSPHKFDKFSLDKIGTGEGAQAYGHGAYLAEAKDVGKEYQLALGNKPSAVDDFAGFEAQAAFAKHGGNTKKAIAWLEDRKKLTDDAKQFLMPGAYEKQIGDYNEAIRRIQSGEVSKEAGYLYKTDIPDEAVARFLDWDKPLSQQAPEVQIALKNMQNKQTQNVLDSRVETFNKLRASGQDTKRVERSIEILKEEIANPELQGTSGEGFYKYLRNRLGEQNLATDQLRQYGIPGIRYLDGGSRSTGQGSSNFVAFDPEMIRILERNGQPTGLQPWKPGEWKR